jgi:hypothetical protein
MSMKLKDFSHRDHRVHREIKKQFLLCEKYYAKTSERSEQGSIYALCGVSFSFI